MTSPDVLSDQPSKTSSWLLLVKLVAVSSLEETLMMMIQQFYQLRPSEAGNVRSQGWESFLTLLIEPSSYGLSVLVPSPQISSALGESSSSSLIFLFMVKVRGVSELEGRLWGRMEEFLMNP